MSSGAPPTIMNLEAMIQQIVQPRNMPGSPAKESIVHVPDHLDAIGREASRGYEQYGSPARGTVVELVDYVAIRAAAEAGMRPMGSPAQTSATENLYAYQPPQMSNTHEICGQTFTFAAPPEIHVPQTPSFSSASSPGRSSIMEQQQYQAPAQFSPPPQLMQEPRSYFTPPTEAPKNYFVPPVQQSPLSLDKLKSVPSAYDQYVLPMKEMYGTPTKFEPSSSYGLNGPGEARTLFPGLVERTRPTHEHQPFGWHKHIEKHNIFNTHRGRDAYKKPFEKEHISVDPPWKKPLK